MFLNSLVSELILIITLLKLKEKILQQLLILKFKGFFGAKNI